MIETNGSAPTAVRSPAEQGDHLSRYVRRSFRHTLRGYSPEEVDAHLRQVRGWFTLAGFDRLLADRREEILGDAREEAEATLARAHREAEAVLEDARRQAERIVAEAQQRRESLRTLARAILEETGTAP